MRAYPIVRSCVCFSLLTVTVLGFPGVMHAQTAPPPAMEGTVWIPEISMEPDALPHVEGTRMPGRWNWNAGVAIQLLERPYTLRDLTTDRIRPLVHYQFWTNFLVQLGITRSMAIGLDLPVLLNQNSNREAFPQTSLGTMGFGDVRGTFRWSTRAQFSPGERVAHNAFTNEGPGLSVLVSLSAPTGEGRSLTGQDGWGVHPSVIGDFRLFGLILAGQLGYRARIDRHWPGQENTCATDSTRGTVSCLIDVPLRDAITWSAGLRLPPSLLGGIASAYFEAYGGIDARVPFTRGTTPVELALGAQRTFGEFHATLGVSTGVTDVPGNPRVRGMFLLHWAPRFVDEDGDGLRDNTGEDQCVGLPEDRDGYQDTDGCPEDNDHDDIPDTEDQCPTTDEDTDGYQDTDGCPDPDNDQDQIPDTEDQCPDTPTGPYPDEQHPGCPNQDIDSDGVPNTSDQCPEQPRGNTPDPSRTGCPAPDSDNDNVPDPMDACPNEPAGTNAAPEQHGCPHPDHDHDGVLDTNDRCSEQTETINGVDDDDGCAESPPPRHARIRVRIVRDTPTAPGTIELLEAVRFTANDQVHRASEPVLSQLAVALIATARRPWRYHTLTVAQTPPRVRDAIDASRAARRRDAVLAALRARGVPDWAVRPADPLPPSTSTPQRPARGIVLTLVEAPAPASPAPSVVPSPSAPTPDTPAQPAPASPPAPPTPNTRH